MHHCLYTKDKKKKLKKWEEGFYKYFNNKITVYDSDKKLVCTKVTDLENEIDTFKYLIYIENLEDKENKECEIFTPVCDTKEESADVSEISQKYYFKRSNKDISSDIIDYWRTLSRNYDLPNESKRNFFESIDITCK